MKDNKINEIAINPHCEISSKSNNAVRVKLFHQITNILFTGDSFNYHNNRQFSTKDRDNDESSGNCASARGAFWYGNCAHANLNGEYQGNGKYSVIGVWWAHWKNNLSLKRVEIKIKPN